MPKFKKSRAATNELVGKLGSKAIDFQSSSAQHLNRYVTKRAARIVGIRRFVAFWLCLVVGLCAVTLISWVQLRASGTTNVPTGGGIYTEGVVGKVANLNPLFGSGSVDDSSRQLMFNGLLRYGTNGQLESDMASSWRVEPNRNIYTVDLRRDIRWHDGHPLDAEDVTFTIQTIQNPATRSNLFASWQGIKVAALSQYQLQFELPAPFAPFPNALTLPILPHHLLSDVPAEKLRTAAYNNAPIGTGPFMFQALRSEGDQESLELGQNERYFRGRPRLERFIIRSYKDSNQLTTALKDREITAAVDLKDSNLRGLEKDKSIRLSDIPLNSGVFAFFKTTAPTLGDTGTRRALAMAVDRGPLLKTFSGRYAVLKTPLLSSQLGFDSKYAQTTNLSEAAALLDQAGWKLQPDGRRAKDGQPLELGLTTVNSSEYSKVASELQHQWAKLGITIKPQLLTAEQLQQNALSTHAYDILLYGISIGADPDVYAYWHSSQARSGGLNFSEWKSARADASLEVARTRLEPVLRTARYQTFLDEWQKSAPAVALYQPRTSYAYHQNTSGFVAFPSNSAAERLTNVEAWTVNTRRVQKTP